MSITPMKAIRKKCLDCTNGQYLEVSKCKIKGCPLWVYRSGHRPKINVSVDAQEVNSILNQ